jgi:hypothetical protein
VIEMKLQKQGLEKHSARLRYTLEIAKSVGFDYTAERKNKYGGFFTVFQLESILNKLRRLELVEQELRIIKEERARNEGK